MKIETFTHALEMSEKCASDSLTLISLAGRDAAHERKRKHPLRRQLETGRIGSNPIKEPSATVKSTCRRRGGGGSIRG